MSHTAPAIAHLAIAALIFIAAWSPVDALPAVDAVVPEPDSGQTVFDPHAEAVATFQFLQAQGKDENDCAAFADTIIDGVHKLVSEGQASMNDLSDGSDCASESQEGVTTAEADVGAKMQTLKEKTKVLARAKLAPVDFPAFNLDQLHAGQCDQFYESKEYNDAITTRTNAETAHGAAVDAVDAANAVLEKAVEAGAELKHQCLCDAKKAHDSAWKAVQDMVDTNEKEWTKAHHLKCVAADKSNDDCVVPSTPTVDDKPLVPDAANAECANEQQPPAANEQPAAKCTHDIQPYVMKRYSDVNCNTNERYSQTATIRSNNCIQTGENFSLSFTCNPNGDAKTLLLYTESGDCSGKGFTGTNGLETYQNLFNGGCAELVDGATKKRYSTRFDRPITNYCTLCSAQP